MRILCVHPGAAYSVSDVFDGYVKAFRQLGVPTATYELQTHLAFWSDIKFKDQPLSAEEIVQHAGLELHQKLWEWMPDLVVVISGFYVHPWTWDILKTREHRTAVIFTESPYEDDRQSHLVEKASPDVVILNDPINLDLFTKLHPIVEYLPHCYDPDLHHPGSTKDTDFFFCGTGYPSRIRLFDQVDWTDIDAKLAGHWTDLEGTKLSPFLISPPGECMFNETTADWYRRARVSANLYRGKDPAEANSPDLQKGWAIGPREVELAACRTFFARESRGESDLLFPMLPTFETPEEFGDIVRWALANPGQREVAAQAAFGQIEDRTFISNVRRLLELVDKT